MRIITTETHPAFFNGEVPTQEAVHSVLLAGPFIEPCSVCRGGEWLGGITGGMVASNGFVAGKSAPG